MSFVARTDAHDAELGRQDDIFIPDLHIDNFNLKSRNFRWASPLQNGSKPSYASDLCLLS